MLTLKSLLPIVPLLAVSFLTACDPPEDEAMLQALDEEADLADADEASRANNFGLTATPAPKENTCYFKVKWSIAGVYEEPATVNRKNKSAGDIVGSFCGQQWGWDGNLYQAVGSSSCSDGIGWMRRDALTQI